MRQTLRGSVKTLSKLLQMTKHAVGSDSDIKKKCGKAITARNILLSRMPALWVIENTLP